MTQYIEKCQSQTLLLFLPTKYCHPKTIKGSNVFALKNLNQRFLHRIVAGCSYYSCSSERFDAVMVKAGECYFRAGNKNEKLLILDCKGTSLCMRRLESKRGRFLHSAQQKFLPKCDIN